MPASFIFGLEGRQLSPKEKAFFRDCDPWGYILFDRNIETANQLIALCNDLREISGRADTPILMDQEGGRVQRLTPPLIDNHPPAAQYGKLYNQDKEKSIEAAMLGGFILASALRRLGISVNCAPVLDIAFPNANPIIGNRAFSDKAEIIVTLATAFQKGMEQASIASVIKHIPGHGRANADSHLILPVIEEEQEVLEQTDFLPFHKLNNSPMAMTAHILYSSLDKDNPSSTSSKIIKKVIREHIGFSGLIMSDDIAMKALQGSMGERAEKTLQAGCDIALHCTGNLSEMLEIANKTINLADKSLMRAEQASSLWLAEHHLATQEDVEKWKKLLA